MFYIKVIEKIERFKMVKNFRIKMFVMLIGVIMFTSSCYKKNEEENLDVLFNSNQMKCAENDDYIFFIYNFLSETLFSFENKITNDTGEFIKNPFKENFELKQMIFLKGEKLYYMYFTRDYSERGLYYAYDKFRIVELDTNDFDEKIVLEIKMNRVDNFLGLQEENNDELDFYISVTSFFLDDDYFYFANSEGIWSVNRRSRKRNKIIESKVMRDYAYDGTNIFFINDFLQIVIYNTKSKEKEVLQDIVTENFVLTDMKLFFLNRRDKSKIYSYDLKNKNIEKVSDKEISFFVCNNRYIYYRNIYSNNLNRMDVNGEKDIVIYDKGINNAYLFNEIFVFTSDEGNLVRLQNTF